MSLKNMTIMVIIWAVALVMWTEGYLPEAIMDNETLNLLTFLIMNVGLAFGFVKFGMDM